MRKQHDLARVLRYTSFMKHLALSLIILAAPLMPQGSAVAQTSEEAKKAQARRALEAAERRVDADMVGMTDLAEALAYNLGQLHYLRTICFGKDDQTWRDHAQDMMGVEADGDAVRRRVLVNSFNDGYYKEESRYSHCSDSLSVDAAAIAHNGRRLAIMLADPYREN